MGPFSFGGDMLVELLFRLKMCALSEFQVTTLRRGNAQLTLRRFNRYQAGAWAVGSHAGASWVAVPTLEHGSECCGRPRVHRSGAHVPHGSLFTWESIAGCVASFLLQMMGCNAAVESTHAAHGH